MSTIRFLFSLLCFIHVGFNFCVYPEQNDLVAYPHISFVFCQKKYVFNVGHLTFFATSHATVITACVSSVNAYTHIDIYMVSFDL